MIHQCIRQLEFEQCRLWVSCEDELCLETLNETKKKQMTIISSYFDNVTEIIK